MGLELPTAKAIVDALGGRIELQSTPGRGAVFHVLLPLELAVGRAAEIENPDA